MVYTVLDTFIKKSTEREIHIRYDPTIANDELIMRKLRDLLYNEQPLCSNCNNYYKEGYFCGYNASCCRIHGCLEGYDHPHRDGDGSKCPDYTRRTTETNAQKSLSQTYYTIKKITQTEEEKALLAKYQAKLNALKEADE